MIEAMACGVPIIIGNTSAMPEVSGPGALAVDPYKPEEIANMLLRLEVDETLYLKQRNYGLLRAQQFSWAKTANELVQLYHSLRL